MMVCQIWPSNYNVDTPIEGILITMFSEQSETSVIYSKIYIWTLDNWEQ